MPTLPCSSVRKVCPQALLENIEIVVGDATQEGDLQQAVQVASNKGAIDGIVHCVGSIVIRPPHAMKKEGFEEVISTNLTSAFLTLSIGGKSMLRNGGGRMVFCSSVAGSIGLVNHEAISAAKGGIESMVRSIWPRPMLNVDSELTRLHPV